MYQEYLFQNDLTILSGEDVRQAWITHIYDEKKNNWEPTGYYSYPRSSISKTPLLLANNVGIIDSGYRGNIKVAFDNYSQNIHI